MPPKEAEVGCGSQWEERMQTVETQEKHLLLCFEGLKVMSSICHVSEIVSTRVVSSFIMLIFDFPDVVEVIPFDVSYYS